MFFRRPISATQPQAMWPVLVLVCIAIIAPTACVLWFMNQAVRSEQFAVRQRLEDVYRSRLSEARRSLDNYWQSKLNALRIEPGEAAPQTFARLVLSHAADSIVVSDPTGRSLYPDDTSLSESVEVELDQEWAQACDFEFISHRPAEAADAYGSLAARTKNIDLAARAYLAQARTLGQAGQLSQARGVLAGPLSEQNYLGARDAQGRLISCNAQLMLLLMGPPTTPEFRKTADALIRRVQDYREPAVPAGQRRFLMEQLKSLLPDCPSFPTLAAEDLAASYLNSQVQMAAGPGTQKPARPVLSAQGDLWCLPSQDGTILALYHRKDVDSNLQSLIDHTVALPDVSVTLKAYDDPVRIPQTFITVPAGEFLPQYQMALSLQGPDPLAAAARRRVLLYMWTGGSGIFVIVLLGLLLARLMTRQIALARLKNDLVATVTHELKTPLASMRVLIDTLAEGRVENDRAQEYYQLISRENERLSRLIENFLTFSRMERDKQTFSMKKMDLSRVIDAAVAAMGERLQPPRCRLKIKVAPDPPMIMGDRDAILTVVLNLLDNACKYSRSNLEIEINAQSEVGQVHLQVRDNGIGMSRRTVKRVFDRFYQADLSLSRRAGGCGLGLSIVKFIVDAHGGGVDVWSEPGMGSIFTVTFPAATSETSEMSMLESVPHA